MLNRNLPQLRIHPKEYNLLAPVPEKVRSRQPGTAFVFSEKDLPGYKSKTFGWDDVDEEGNPGQGRSYLYEKHKKELKKKENKGRFVPYTKRSIPKQTAIAGIVDREFEVTPIKNDEFFALEEAQARTLLKPPEKKEALYALDDPGRMQTGLLTMQDRAAINKVRNIDKIRIDNLTRFRHLKIGNKLLKTAVLLVSRNHNLSTNYWISSDNIEYGAYEISKARYSNQNLISVQFLMRLHSCGSTVISMVNGN